MKKTSALRAFAAACAALMTMLVAACASNSTNSAPGATSSASPATAASTPSHAGGHVVGAPPPTLPLRPGEQFSNLKMAKPYTPVAPNGGTDEYRCLVIDPHLAKSAYLTGTQFTVGNQQLVHHAIVFAIPPGEAALARSKDAASGGHGWTCFGNSALGEGTKESWVDTWTPNAGEAYLKQDVGFPLQAGSLMVVQIHYNLMGSAGRAAGSDQSGVRLRLTQGDAATQALRTVPLQVPVELPCPAGVSGPLCNRAAAQADVIKRFGAAGNTEAELLSQCGNGTPVPGDTQHCDYPVPVPMTVYASLGHMHLLGHSIKIEVNPGTPHAKTLLNVPAFNFDYQKFTPIAPVDVKPGDTVRVTCNHDPTLRQQLPQLKSLPPRYVIWGDGTSDEMCLGLLTAVVKK
ncbi:hypothetical protein ABZ357_11420 [Streptomyces sp. NPDC005917]|uniref:monooxygenase n=1 Tax=unclassified Streptomyces TaxID=2593676 RepID=UPI003406B77C